jgi:serine/threonine protein kinase
MSAFRNDETKAQSMGVKVVSDIEQPYNKGKLVGKGGHGHVFVAHSWDQPEWVCAIKEIDIFGNTKIFSRVVNEIAQLKKLNHHNVLHFENAYYTKDDLDRPFQMSIVITPYIPWNLTTFLQHLENTEYGNISWPWYFSQSSQQGWQTLIQGLLHGLGYLHSQQPPLKHRDLKPENILITMYGENPRAVITDFGSCKEFIIGAATTHHYYTKTYEAPEQANTPRGGKVPAATPAMDVFQMGCCLTWIEGAMWGSEEGVHKVDKAVYRDSHQFAFNVGRVNRVLNEYCDLADQTTNIDEWARIRLREVITSMVLEDPEERATVMAAADEVDKMILQFDEGICGRQEGQGSSNWLPDMETVDAVFEGWQSTQGSSDYYPRMDTDQWH